MFFFKVTSSRTCPNFPCYWHHYKEVHQLSGVLPPDRLLNILGWEP